MEHAFLSEKFPPGRQDYLFKFSLFTENFPEERLKNVCASAPFTPQPEFLGKRDRPVIVIEPAFIF